MEVGEIDIIQETVDGVIYNLWGMKEPNYVMRMMAAGVRLLEYDTTKDTLRIWKENGEYLVKYFNKNLPFHWNFCYRHAVDNHNNFRHELSSV